MIFKCHPELKIYAKGWYDYNDLSTAVGYWVNFLQTRNTLLPLGVLVSESITFSGVAFLLALYQTKTNFIYLPQHLNYINNEFQKNYNLDFELIVVGNNNNPNIPKLTSSTEDFFHASQMFKQKFNSLLEFSFEDSHVISNLTSGTTDKPKLISTNAFKEGRSVQSAIDTYFDIDDICLFSHEMTHKGVHTTAILPALFSVKKLFLLTTQEWPRFIDQATHCQWFAIMKDFYKLTPNLKKITFGGSKLSASTAEFILTQAPDATIYDIYGLTESLPPVAIRKVTRHNFPTQFEICQKELTVETDNSRLCIIDNITGIKTKTGDIVNQIDNTHFEFIGRDKKEVRINGSLVNVSTVGSMLEKEFSTNLFSIDAIDETLVIQTIENSDVFRDWCIDKKVEDFKIIIVESISTAGGIKTITQ